MANTDFQSVDQYLATKSDHLQSVLQRVRTAIRNAVPDAEEVISYQIPAYKVQGDTVLFFAGWKQHFSLYPASDALVAKFHDDIAGYKVSKGTIRFPLDQPVPVALIGRLAKFRAQEVGAEARAKAAAKAVRSR